MAIGATGGAWRMQQVFELVFEIGPDIGLPHEKDRKDVVVVESTRPAGSCLCSAGFGDKAPLYFRYLGQLARRSRIAAEVAVGGSRPTSSDGSL